MSLDSGLSDERIKQLLGIYGKRIASTPFSIGEIPSDAERQLTKNIWASIEDKEKSEILKRCTNMVSEKIRIPSERIPDQTPYAMRLLHMFLKQES